MPPPSRSPEARHAEYLRNKHKRGKGYDLGSAHYARKVIAQESGLSVQQVPATLVEAKRIQLNILRAVRAGQESAIYPAICKRYLAGATVRDLSVEYGFDRARVSAILRQNGIVPKRRPFCKNGHAMAGGNMRLTKEGWRRCRKCASEKTMRQYLRKKDAPLDTSRPPD